MKKCKLGIFYKIISFLALLLVIAPTAVFSLYMFLFESGAFRDERLLFLAGVVLCGGVFLFACYRVVYLGLIWVEYDAERVIFHFSRKEQHCFRWEEIPGNRIVLGKANRGYLFQIQGDRNVRKIPVGPMHAGFRDFKKMLEAKGVLQKSGLKNQADYVNDAEQVFRQFNQYLQAHPDSTPQRTEGGSVCCPECQGKGIHVKRMPVLKVSVGKVCQFCGGSGQLSFYQVSKRARAAYLILCLEQVLLFYGLDFEKWDWVLKKLWEITSTNDEESWIFQISDLLPEEVLTHRTLEEVEAERKGMAIYFCYSFSEERFQYFGKLYREAGHPTAEQVLENIYHVVAEEWGQAEEANTPSSLSYIEETEKLLTEQKIPLPTDPQTLKFLMGHRDPHLGKPFDGLQFSRCRH